MKLNAINVDSSLVYCDPDKFSGRCRIHKKTFASLKAKLGYVVQIKLDFGAKGSCEVLCTLWPDQNACIQESELCLDPSVVISGSLPISWCDCSCEILNVGPQKTCSSIYTHPSNMDTRAYELLSSSALVGLPIIADCSISFPSSSQSSGSILVSRINGQGFGSIVSSSTILIKQPPLPSIKTTTNTEIFCAIKVVRELIDRVVRPSIDLPSVVQYKGVMLLGPPGVGKTYAVKAVKNICKDWCKIHVMELSIPMLLAESDPLQRLDNIFNTLQQLSKKKYPRQSSSVSLPGSAAPTPAKSGYSHPNTPLTSNANYGSNNSVPSTPMSASSSSQVTPMSSNVKTPLKYTPVKKNMSVSSVAENSAGAFKFKSPSSTTSFLGKKQDAIGSPSSAVEKEFEVEGATEFNSSTVFMPELVFLVVDEIDALGQGGSQNTTQNAIKHKICTWLDAINASNNESNSSKQAASIVSRVRCCLLATSNRAEDTDSCFRRGGRLEQELVVMTTPQDRSILLQTLLQNTFNNSQDPLSLSDTEVKTLSEVLAERTGGYVAADLVALVREMNSLISEKGEDRSQSNISTAFELAIKSVPPSCLRGVSIQVPKISYDDIIGYSTIKKSLQRVLSFSSPGMREMVKRFNLSAPGGVLLHGPPGNCKTRLVMAAACHHGLPVISLTSADIFSPYVGDAEAEIRKAFRVARQARPCILFIDELDSIVTNRSGGGEGVSTGVEGRILATLLTEMDGIQGDDDRATTESEGSVYSNSGGVIVLGATNRLDFIDAALIRKGRFHHVLYVPLPNEEERILILQHFVKKCALDNTSFEHLLTLIRDGMSGADIENLCREEVMKSMK